MLDNDASIEITMENRKFSEKKALITNADSDITAGQRQIRDGKINDQTRNPLA